MNLKTKIAVVDFETYYDKEYSVSSMSYWHYCHHEKFDPYLVSIVTSEGFEWVGHPKDAPWESVRDHAWVSHNRPFDQSVYLGAQVLGIVPNWVPAYWGNSANLCAYHRLPRALAKAVAAKYGIKHSKTIRDKTMLDAKWSDHPAKVQEQIKEYALEDSRLSLRLWLDLIDTWPEKERRLADSYDDRGLRGLAVDVEGLNKDIGVLQRVLFEARARIPWSEQCTDGEGLLAREKLDEYCRSVGLVAPASLDMKNADCSAWEEEHGDEHPVIGAMRDYRRANSVLMKYETIRSRTKPDGRFEFPTSYMGTHCVTGDHEVLTRNGWEPLSAWAGGDIVQWHDNGSLSFLPAKPNAFLREQPLLNISGPYINAVLTDGHTLPIYNTRGDFMRESAAEVRERRTPVLTPVAGRLTHLGDDTPEVGGRIFAAVQADGHWTRLNELQFCLRKERKIRRVQSLFQEAGIPFRVNEFPSTPGQIRVSVSRRHCPSWLTPNRKKFGPWVLSLPGRTINALVDELKYWDGYEGPSGSEYYTSEKENAEWVHCMCHLSGVSTKIRSRALNGRKESHRLFFRLRDTAQIRKSHWAESERDDEIVYCPTTETGWWLCRFNGTIFVTGNTGRSSGTDKNGERGKLNMLNMPRDPFFVTTEWKLISKKEDVARITEHIKKNKCLPDDISHAVDLRRKIIPGPGKKFIICDKSQIEARITVWLAKDRKTLDLIRKGVSVYEAHAIQTMGWVAGPVSLKKKAPQVYSLAKARVLALGFNAGHSKFLEMAKLYVSEEEYDVIFSAPQEPAAYDRYTTWLIDKKQNAVLAQFKVASAKKKLMLVNSWLIVEDFRAKNPGITALWESLDNELKAAVGTDYEIELPSGRSLKYHNLRWEDSKTNKGKKDLVCNPIIGGPDFYPYGGKLLENCLAGDTEVLVKDRGWVPITELQLEDLVFDGVEFVSHEGVLHMGTQPVIECHGVLCTEDHMFKTVHGGWIPANKLSKINGGIYHGTLESVEARGYSQPSVRIANSDKEAGIKRNTYPVGSDVLLRGDGSKNDERHETHENLRTEMPSFLEAGIQCDHASRDVPPSGIRGVALDEATVRGQKSPGFPQLWGSRYLGVQKMVRWFSELLVGHGPLVGPRTGTRPDGQQCGVLPGELPLDHPQGKREESEKLCDPVMGVGCGEGKPNPEIDTRIQTESRSARGSRMLTAPGQLADVYDIFCCGPRHRFAVKGAEGILIAHNCAQAIARDCFMEDQLNLIDAGHEPVLDIYDEVIVETPLETDPKEIERIMSLSPEWAKTLPIGAEAEESKFYKK